MRHRIKTIMIVASILASGIHLYTSTARAEGVVAEAAKGSQDQVVSALSWTEIKDAILSAEWNQLRFERFYKGKPVSLGANLEKVTSLGSTDVWRVTGVMVDKNVEVDCSVHDSNALKMLSMMAKEAKITIAGNIDSVSSGSINLADKCTVAPR